MYYFQTSMMEQLGKNVESAFSSFAQFTEMATDAIDKTSRNQYSAMNDAIEAHASQIRQMSSFYTGIKKLDHASVPQKIGHVALVTGGTGGIGTDICKQLALVGNKVVATHLSFEKDAAEKWRKTLVKEGFDIDLVECDVTDFDSCQAMSELVQNKFGSIDILVNCAGITRDGMLRKMDESNWHAVLDTNLDSVFNVTRNVIDGMIERQYGRIINISSVNGQKGQFGQTNYSAAKAGMKGFTKSLARELADQGITVNTVSPGYVATSMVMAIDKEVRQSIVDTIPVGRLAEPAEIGRAVSFLASPDNGYITGANLSINGGLHMA